MSEECVEQVTESFTLCPKKLVWNASHELAILVMSVWTLKTTLLPFAIVINSKPYRPQLMCQLCKHFSAWRWRFSGLCCVVFSDEWTFLLSGKEITHNVNIWESENPLEMEQLAWDSPKLSVLCQILTESLWIFLFWWSNCNRCFLSRCSMTIWLFPQLEKA